MNPDDITIKWNHEIYTSIDLTAYDWLPEWNNELTPEINRFLIQWKLVSHSDRKERYEIKTKDENILNFLDWKNTDLAMYGWLKKEDTDEVVNVYIPNIADWAVCYSGKDDKRGLWVKAEYREGTPEWSIGKHVWYKLGQPYTFVERGVERRHNSVWMECERYWWLIYDVWERAFNVHIARSLSSLLVGVVSGLGKEVNQVVGKYCSEVEDFICLEELLLWDDKDVIALIQMLGFCENVVGFGYDSENDVLDCLRMTLILFDYVWYMYYIKEDSDKKLMNEVDCFVVWIKDQIEKHMDDKKKNKSKIRKVKSDVVLKSLSTVNKSKKKSEKNLKKNQENDITRNENTDLIKILQDHLSDDQNMEKEIKKDKKIKKKKKEKVLPHPLAKQDNYIVSNFQRKIIRNEQNDVNYITSILDQYLVVNKVSKRLEFIQQIEKKIKNHKLLPPYHSTGLNEKILQCIDKNITVYISKSTLPNNNITKKLLRIQKILDQLLFGMAVDIDEYIERMKSIMEHYPTQIAPNRLMVRLGAMMGRCKQTFTINENDRPHIQLLLSYLLFKRSPKIAKLINSTNEILIKIKERQGDEVWLRKIFDKFRIWKQIWLYNSNSKKSPTLSMKELKRKERSSIDTLSFKDIKQKKTRLLTDEQVEREKRKKERASIKTPFENVVPLGGEKNKFEDIKIPKKTGIKRKRTTNWVEKLSEESEPASKVLDTKRLLSDVLGRTNLNLKSSRSNQKDDKIDIIDIFDDSDDTEYDSGDKRNRKKKKRNKIVNSTIFFNATGYNEDKSFVIKTMDKQESINSLSSWGNEIDHNWKVIGATEY